MTMVRASVRRDDPQTQRCLRMAARRFADIRIKFLDHDETYLYVEIEGPEDLTPYWEEHERLLKNS